MQSAPYLYRHSSEDRTCNGRCESPQESSGNDPSPVKGDIDEELHDLEDENDDSDACNRQHDFKDIRPRKPHLQA